MTNAHSLIRLCRSYGVCLGVINDRLRVRGLTPQLQHWIPTLKTYRDAIIEALKNDSKEVTDKADKTDRSPTPAHRDAISEASKNDSKEATDKAVNTDKSPAPASDSHDVPFCRGAVVFDIETDSLTPTQLWCVCAVELDNGTEHVFGPDRLGDAVKLLNDALSLIGHNIISFDVPALRKLRPDFAPMADVFDTLVLARMLHPEHQRHRLRDWGERLECPKQPQPNFDRWSDEMADYCLQDVRLNVRLWQHLLEHKPPDIAVRREMAFAQLCHDMTQHGICFDSDAAQRLDVELRDEQQQLRQALETAFPDRQQTLFDTGSGFNPDSSHHIARALHRKHGWTAPRSKHGNPICDEATLSKLPYADAATILQYREVTGHIGKLSDGPSAWRKLVTAGRIHHRVNTCAAVTARCGHSAPNLAQVPAEARFRRLFKPSDGRVLIGVDLSGIEARALAHYLHEYDGGQFAQTLLQGDIHEFNRQAAGLDTRAQAKRLLYATLYGGGAACIGDIIGGTPAEGKAVINRWLTQVPALRQLKTATQLQFQTQGYITAIDGRRIRPRKKHTALNSLLQSCAAIIAKLWAVLAVHELQQRAQLLLHVHDEMQFECEQADADNVARIVIEAAAEAGRRLQLTVPVDAEAKHGSDWSRTH